MVYDKTNKHSSPYDSYNVELASTQTESSKLENAANHYNASNKIKFDLTNKNDQLLLYRQFSAWYCFGCSIAPLPDYANNKTFRELPRLRIFYLDTDEKLFIIWEEVKVTQMK